MTGLGDVKPTLTPQQIGYLLLAVHNSKDDPAVKANLAAVACLDTQWMQLLGACKVGVTPPGMNDLQFYSAAMALVAAGMFDKMGCPGDADWMLKSMPACLQAGNADHQPFIDIINNCKAHPTFQGGNKTYDAACWAMSRYPNVYQQFVNTPLCAAAVTPPAYTPPAYTPPPATTTTTSYTAPPPLDTSAAVTYDSGAATAPDSTATDLFAGGGAPSDGGGATTAQAGMSTTTMAMIGVGGVLALGLGYMLLRKK
jgi:hypothetical protein